MSDNFSIYNSTQHYFTLILKLSESGTWILVYIILKLCDSYKFLWTHSPWPNSFFTKSWPALTTQDHV
uniref:Uncharacterized protein n=1 Tax=Rhizophora mucronata TaxID=61149 RepID=A0A2P2N1V4_RHIMU